MKNIFRKKDFTGLVVSSNYRNFEPNETYSYEQ